MSTVKTAVSMDDKLYKKVNHLARQQHVSRSRLIAIALEEYLRVQENRRMLNALDEAYHDTEEDRGLLDSVLENHKELLEDEEW